MIFDRSGSARARYDTTFEIVGMKVFSDGTGTVYYQHGSSHCEYPITPAHKSILGPVFRRFAELIAGEHDVLHRGHYVWRDGKWVEAVEDDDANHG